MKFNAHGPAGLIDRKLSRLTEADRAAVAAVVESGPMPAVHGVVRWRVINLCQWLWDERQMVIAKQTLSRELRRMGGAAKGSARKASGMAAEGIASCRRVCVTMPKRRARSTL